MNAPGKGHFTTDSPIPDGLCFASLLSSLLGNVLLRPKHELGAHEAIKLLLREQLEAERGFLERQAFLVRELGGLGGSIVANLGVECGDEHERLVHNGVEALAVGLDADNAVLRERARRIAEEANGTEDVVDDDGLEDVKLKVAVETAHGDGRVVPDDFGADHRDGLALRGVNLARHDRRAGLVLGKKELAQAAAGAGAEEADVVRDLHEGHGDRVERAAQLHEGVVRGECLKLVRRSLEGELRDGGDFAGDGRVKALERVQSRADGSATRCELVHVGKRRLDALNPIGDLLHVAGELLAEGQRRRVLRVRAPNLDDAVKLLPLCVEGVAEDDKARQKHRVDLLGRSNVHRRGERVIGRLAHVDVVVGVHQLPAELATEQLNRAVRNHLVDVHVRLGSRARLPNDEGEFVDQLAADDLVGRLHDGISDLRVEAKLHVDLCRRLLENTEGLDEGLGHALTVTANLKVLERALRLRAPVTVGGDVDGTERVLLSAELAIRKRSGRGPCTLR
eukprot:Opistho-1_new@32269